FRTGVFSGAPSILEGGSGLLDKGFVDVHGDDVEQNVQVNADAIRKVIQTSIASDPALAAMKDAVQVQITADGLLITFTDNNEDLLFDLSSSALKRPLVKVLENLAPVLHQTGYRLRIQGHTDARPFPQGSV